MYFSGRRADVYILNVWIVPLLLRIFRYDFELFHQLVVYFVVVRYIIIYSKFSFCRSSHSLFVVCIIFREFQNDGYSLVFYEFSFLDRHILFISLYKRYLSSNFRALTPCEFKFVVMLCRSTFPYLKRIIVHFPVLWCPRNMVSR